ncbi:hypothetical protein [Bradyrhizobium sp. 150]|uniref:hypothetical protein n=1 Tax=Bradyrhizobium sp. 150 TaxID=2782625 RepID=UPI001FF776D3|nr:hypothetical protein [Bradyrhizobium sp. 150]MCK1670345.1 hypothetical protein [Bradyrhizobium sp. 150]
MTDPKDYAEYARLSERNAKVGGSGLDTYMEPACPFCAAPKFARWSIVDMEGTASKEATCTNCGRSAKLIFTRGSQNEVSFEVVQTGGPDQPDWLQPKMRRT